MPSITLKAVYSFAGTLLHKSLLDLSSIETPRLAKSWVND